MTNIHFPKKILDALYPSIGALVISWSIVEHNLDYWVAILFRSGGNKIQSEIPKSLSRKIDFLRKCFKRFPELNPFAKEALGYIDKVEELSDIRHTIIHGSVSEYDEATKKVLFVKIEIDKKEMIHAFENRHLSINQLLEAGEETVKLMTSMLNFGARFLDEFVPKNGSHDS